MYFRTQKEMFNYIWETRPHVSQLTGVPLEHQKGSKMWHWQFLHVLPKGKFKKYALNSDNILLGTPEEHENQNKYQVFNDRYTELHQQYYRQHYNKEF